MDYTPVNLAPKGVKQGDYFTTTIGPYDYWAIEYAYKPLPAAPTASDELKKIAARAPTPGLDYAHRRGHVRAADPLVNVWDLGADPMKFAQDRMLLAEELLKELADRVVDEGRGLPADARQAFNVLLGQYGNGGVPGRPSSSAASTSTATTAATRTAATRSCRSTAGQAAGGAEVPAGPHPDRQAVPVLAGAAAQLAADRWMHWGNETSATSVDFPVYDRDPGHPADGAGPAAQPGRAAAHPEQRA